MMSGALLRLGRQGELLLVGVPGAAALEGRLDLDALRRALLLERRVQPVGRRDQVVAAIERRRVRADGPGDELDDLAARDGAGRLCSTTGVGGAGLAAGLGGGRSRGRGGWLGGRRGGLGLGRLRARLRRSLAWPAPMAPASSNRRWRGRPTPHPRASSSARRRGSRIRFPPRLRVVATASLCERSCQSPASPCPVVQAA